MNTKRADSLSPIRKAMHHLSWMALLVAFFISSAAILRAQGAQKNPGSARLVRKRHAAPLQKSPLPAKIEAAEVLPAPPPPPPPPPLTPEQKPPEKPQVLWDGSQLTIIAQNSTLADILAEVKALTGTTLDLPPDASRERMAAKLGPGPARQVLSSLLSGTSFDYIILASDTDPAGVHTVMLTPRGKNDTTMAKAGMEPFPESPARYPYRSSSRPNPAPEPAPTPEPTPAPETASAQPEPAAEQAPTQSTAPDQQAAKTVAQAQSGETSVPPPDAQPAPTDVTAAVADTNANPALSESQQRIQNMQNLFQQRRQMIEDSNKPPPPAN